MGAVLKDASLPNFRCAGAVADTDTPNIFYRSLEALGWLFVEEDSVDLERRFGTCALGLHWLQTQDIQAHCMAGKSQLLHPVQSSGCPACASCVRPPPPSLQVLAIFLGLPPPKHSKLPEFSSLRP